MTPRMSSTLSPQIRSTSDGEAMGAGGDEQMDSSTNYALGDIEEGEESQKVKTLPSPSPPSRQEMLEHNITHWPFRSWCNHCIAGKAKANKHSPTGGMSQSEVPVVSMDYAFKGDKSIEEED